MFPRIGFSLAIITAALPIAIGGCYYAATTKPPAAAKNATSLHVPYDLTWDAVHSVIRDRDFKVEGDDPNHGIVEAESHSFTLADADCGQMRSVANKFDAEPLAGGSAVYNFRVEPAGPESTNLSVTATYTTPLHVPFHQITNFECVSRGTQEARLLKEVESAATSERRPSEDFSAPRKKLTPGRPTLLRPNFLTKPGS